MIVRPDTSTAGNSVEELGSLLRKGQPRVALDVDGTMANVLDLMLAGYNTKHGTTYTAADHRDWNFKSINSNYEEMMHFYTDAWKNNYRSIKFTGDSAQMRELARHYEVSIVTTRSPDSSGATGGTVENLQNWLKMHGLDSYPLEVCPPDKSKADMGYDIYIDDSPKVAEEVIAKGKLILLIDMPYNRYIRDGDSVVRVKNVQEAMQVLIESAAKERAVSVAKSVSLS